MNDGGPAYASLSVRDYFAAAAMQGLLAKPVPVITRSEDGKTLSTAHDNLGEIAYQIANDMLSARTK